MNLFIDESGSINNKLETPFVIAIVNVLDFKKLNTVIKRFVTSRFKKLKELDQDFYNSYGKLTKTGNQMFHNGKFKELKGSQFDKEMKKDFVEFITKKKYFELYYLKIDNKLLTDKICENTARAFNYTLKLALSYFISHKLICDENCLIQLDERNERTEARFFLENYLNTELCLNNITEKHFTVKYLDSSDNPFIQIADILANVYYSHLNTLNYEDEMRKLKDKKILISEFSFPSR